MLTVLLPVDGSDNAQRAVDYVVHLAGMLKEPPRAHLLNVRMALVGVNVKLFIKKDDLNEYYRDEGTVALQRARASLDAANVAYRHHIGVGDPGSVIVQYAQSEKCDQIVMGRRGLTPVAELILGSVTNKVVSLARVPVVLVS